MGSWSSKPVKNVPSTTEISPAARRIQERYEEERIRGREEISRKEEEQHGELEKELADQTAKAQEKSEKEIEEFRKENMEKMKKNVENFKETRKEIASKLTEVEKQIIETNDQLIEKKKEEGIEQMTAEKNQLIEDKEKLCRQKEYLVEQNDILSQIQKTIGTEKSEMMKEKDKEEMEVLREHEKELKELNDKKNEAVIKGEEEMTKVTEEYRNFQMDMKEKMVALNEVQLNNAFKLLSIHDETQKFDDFRRRFQQVIRLFSTFRGDFNREEKSIYSTRDDIRDGIELSDQPDFSDMLSSLRDLTNEIESFQLSGSRDEEKYEKIRKECKDIVEKLKEVLARIESKISRYEKSRQTSSRQTPYKPPKSEKDSYIDSLDDSDSPLNSPPPSYKPSENRSSDSIVEDCTTTKQLMSELSDLILQFNISASTAFNDTLINQFASHSQTIHQIENGPSTPQMITENDSKSSTSQNSQKVDESSSDEHDE